MTAVVVGVVVVVVVVTVVVESALFVDVAVAIEDIDDVTEDVRPVDAPRAWMLLTLPLLLRRLLADAKPLLLPLLAAVPLPRPIGSETGGNSGLTVLIEVPGVIGVAGVGCTQLCCTVVRGSVFSADDMVVVRERLEDNGVLMPIWLDAEPLLDNCTGG